MGMFDSIIINVEKLPVTQEEKKLLTDAVFQTKDLDNSLFLYMISDDDELLLSKQKDSSSFKAYFFSAEKLTTKPDNIFFEKVEYHGI